ncbi:hypothetical protein, partial [Sphingobacterium chungjuense]|uniref:hypothetical protein n=1 Tax=Sphingobacterium chungjuense TaxID=2675553 RepID=UPI0019CF6CB2
MKYGYKQSGNSVGTLWWQGFCSTPHNAKNPSFFDEGFLCGAFRIGSAAQHPAHDLEPSRIEPRPTLLFDSSQHKKSLIFR